MQKCAYPCLRHSFVASQWGVSGASPFMLSRGGRKTAACRAVRSTNMRKYVLMYE